MGELIFIDTGLKVPVTMCSIDAVETIDTEPATPNKMRSILAGDHSAELTITTRFDNLSLLSLFTGRKMTNNWMKMHGGVMRRKRGLRL